MDLVGPAGDVERGSVVEAAGSDVLAEPLVELCLRRFPDRRRNPVAIDASYAFEELWQIGSDLLVGIDAVRHVVRAERQENQVGLEARDELDEVIVLRKFVDRPALDDVAMVL